MKTLPQLMPVEIRVLGSLIEKSMTTPDYYPMTLNAVITACNQKTSRFPVVEYNKTIVMQALQNLQALKLVSTSVGGTSHTTKFKHNFTTVFPVTPSELAILSLLFLRGPQTPGQLNTNSARLHTFISLQEVILSLQLLMNHEPPLVKELPKKPGQKETRFIQLFGAGEMEETMDHEQDKADSGVLARLEALELEVAQLKAQLDAFMGNVFEIEN